MNGLVIIETRKGVGLSETVESHFKKLGSDWCGLIFCSNENKSELISLGFVNQFIVNPTNHIVLNSNSLNQDQYNKIVVSPLFWDLLPFDKVLITQTDAKMLRGGIEEFMPYDYCGAPWTFAEHGGNGGFSLRTVSVMKKICDDFRYDPSMGNEDIFFSNIMKAYPHYGKLAPREVCEKFSCESIFKLGTLGCHAIEKYFTKEQVEQVLNQYK